MTLDAAYWTALADDYASASLDPRGLGKPVPRNAILLAMAVAEGETNNGRAWPGEWNFGAVQLRTLTDAERASFAAGDLKPGSRTTDTHRADVPQGALHVDTHPTPAGPQPYPVFFAAFPDRVWGIAFFLRTLWRLSIGSTGAPIAEAHGCTPDDLARAMYLHGYFEGSHAGARPMGQRTVALTPPEAANVGDYAASIRRCMAAITPMLAGWDPPWHEAITDDSHPAAGNQPEPSA